MWTRTLRNKFFLFGNFLLTYRGLFLYFSLGCVPFVYDFGDFSKISLFFLLVFWILFHIFLTDLATRNVSIVALILLFAISAYVLHAKTIEAFYGAVFLLVVGVIVKYGGRYFFQKESLGWGDVWLLGISGLWIPFRFCPLFLMTVGSSGAIWGLLQSGKSEKIPLASVMGLCLAYYIFALFRQEAACHF